MTAPSVVTGTLPVYQLLQERILSYVPAGPALPSVPLSAVTNAAGQAFTCWIIRPRDNCPCPFATLLLGPRTTDGADHGEYENFDLEVQVFNRPPTIAGLTLLERIADQIQAALTDFKAIGPLTIRNCRARRTMPTTMQAADRDVVREIMYFSGFSVPAYLWQEIGSS